jgi:hypothetical protein
MELHDQSFDLVVDGIGANGLRRGKSEHESAYGGY